MRAVFTRLLLLCRLFSCSAVSVGPSPVHQCCIGRTLKLGLFPTNFPPYFSFDNETRTYTGFIPDMWRLICEDMGAVAAIVQTTTPPGAPAQAERFQHADAEMVLVQGAVYVGPGREDVATTATFYDMAFDTITLKVQNVRNTFALFDPFQGDLWAANLACFFSAGILLILFNAISPSDEFADVPLMERLAPQTWVMSFYHMAAFFISGEDYEWTTWPGRILRLGLLFLSLVTTASYTANLAAFFTQPSFRLLGPVDLDELATSRACTTFSLQAPGLSSFVGSITSLEEPAPSSGLPLPSIYDRQQWCLQRLRDKDVDAFVVSAAETLALLKADCDGLAVRPNQQLGSDQLAWVVSAHDPFLSNLSAGTMYLKTLPKYGELMQKYFHLGERVCPAEQSGTVQLDVQSQRGLFYIFGTAAGLSAVMAVSQALFQARWRATHPKFGESDVEEQNRNKKAEHTMTVGEGLRLALKKVDAIGHRVTGGSELASDEDFNEASAVGAVVPVALPPSIPEPSAEDLESLKQLQTLHLYDLIKLQTKLRSVRKRVGKSREMDDHEGSAAEALHVPAEDVILSLEDKEGDISEDDC